MAAEKSIFFYKWQNKTVNVKFFHGHWFDFLGTDRAYSNTAWKCPKKETERREHSWKEHVNINSCTQSLTF